jgi:hypothetical protein
VVAGGDEFAGIDDGVVTFAVTEGLGDSEAEAGGFEGEGEFGELSAALGVELVLAGGVESGGLRNRLRARRSGTAARRLHGHDGKIEKAHARGAAP